MEGVISSGSVLNMEEYFSSVQAELEKKESRREEIVSKARELQSCKRKIESLLNKIQTTADDSKTAEAVVKSILDELKSFSSLWKEVDRCIGTDSREKYRGIWASSLSTFTTAAVMAHWLKTQQLVDKEEAAKMIGVGPANECKIDLDLEDYLLGVCSVPSELSRLCVNYVAHGKYDMLEDISKFVTGLFSSFRLLNLKNSNLRYTRNLRE